MSLAGSVSGGILLPQRRIMAVLMAFLMGLLTFAAVSELNADKSQLECGGFQIGVSPIGGCDAIGKKVRTLIPGVPSPVIKDWR